MKYSLIFIAIIFSSIGFTQKVEGVVKYIESIDMSKPIDEMKVRMDSAKKQDNPRAAQMGMFQEKLEEFLKSFERTETVLFFNEQQSLYRERDKELTEEEVNQEQNMFMRWKPETDKIFTSLEEKRTVTTKDFMGKPFLIQDSLKDRKWKVTGKSKKIGEYICMEATCEDTLMKVAAWFTPQIPVSIGPRNFGGLPGLIVQLEIKPAKEEEEQPYKPKKGRGGMRDMKRMMNQMATNFTVTLETVEYREVSKKEVKEPKKGTSVEGEEEYNRIMAEKVKEMQEMRGGKRGGGGPRGRH